MAKKRKRRVSTNTEAESSASDLEKKIARNEERVMIEDFLLKKKKKLLQGKAAGSCSNQQEEGCSTAATDGVDGNEESLATCDQIEEKKEELRYFDMHDDYHGLLFLNENQEVSLCGAVKISVLAGEIEINGFNITASMNLSLAEYDVFSPAIDSLHYLRAVTKQKIQVPEVLNFLKNSKIQTNTDETELEEVHDSYAVVLVKKIKSALPAVLKKLNDYKHFNEEPKFQSQPYDVNVLKTENWRDLADNLQNDFSSGCQCSTMLCGGKNVGKSSLSRYVINRMLNKHPNVFYLELDCGQTEFTSPAVLSLVNVTVPLLGPPFTHQTKPIESYFYGHISPGNSPGVYISIIEQLFKTYQLEHSHEGPLVINQQGWVKGLGLSLLIDTILITSPCNIVQINSSVDSRNLVEDLSDSFLAGQIAWSVEAKYQCLKSNVHPRSYYKVTNSFDDSNKSVGQHKGATSRNLCITSYFSKLYNTSFDAHQSNMAVDKVEWIPPSLSSLLPFVIPWKDVAIHVMHTKVNFNVMLHSFNLALVALASVEPDQFLPNSDMKAGLPQRLKHQPKANYMGLGIVRNIDPVNQLFYILTPEPYDVLQNVNALLKGNIQLPPTYLQDDKCSSHPYYCYDYVNLSTKGASGMKTRFNLKRKPSKQKHTFGEKG